MIYAIVTIAPKNDYANEYERQYRSFGIENRTALHQLNCLAYFLTEATEDAVENGMTIVNTEVFKDSTAFHEAWATLTDKPYFKSF